MLAICSKCFLFFVFFKLGSSRSVHLVRPQQPVHVNIVRLHQRRWTVVLVAPPHQLRSPVHRLRERLRDFVLHGNGCDAFCWLPYFDISTSTPSGMACVYWIIVVVRPRRIFPAASVLQRSRWMILVWHWRTRRHRPFRHDRWIRNIRWSDWSI